MKKLLLVLPVLFVLLTSGSCNRESKDTGRIIEISHHNVGADYYVDIIEIDGQEYLTQDDGGFVKHEPKVDTAYKADDWDYILILNGDEIIIKPDYGDEEIHVHPDSLEEWINHDNL